MIKTMKKLFVMVSALFLMSIVPTQLCAQENSDNQVSGQVQRKGRVKMDPAKMAENRAQRMAKEYNLTNEQQLKLVALFKEEMQNGKGGLRGGFRGMSKEQRDSMQSAMKAQREKLETGLKQILTSEQYAQYTKDVKARMEKMREQMQQRRNGNPAGNE
jgi:Spy/CpxP family protein refolding chaperone